MLTGVEQKILKAARDAFERQTGVKLELFNKAPNQKRLRLHMPEAKALDVTIITNTTGLAYAALLYGDRQQGQGQIAVFNQTTAEMADTLRGNDIQFIDTAGNGYINQPPVYLFVKGNKAKLEIKAPTVNRVFKQTGLRVLYALLCNPGMENDTYRNIATKTGVALGMVNWVFKDLNELGFLLETGTGRAKKIRLINKEKLLERWLNAYTEQLRPKLLLGRYRGTDGWWQNAQLKPEQALWGGETAAAKLTDYLKPQEITIYLDKDNTAAVLIPNRLKIDPTGDVELVARFWQPDTITPNGDMVHPLLVYADLMATGNQRNMETARIIYDEHIIQLIREN